MPFLLLTLVFRAVTIALLVCFLQIWSGIIIFTLFFINVLTALSIGDEFYRSCIYGLWSLFVPVGYARDPSAHLGYTKVSLEDTIPELEVPTEKEIERSRLRAKHFLTVHVMSSGIILGSSLIFLLIYVFTNRALMQQRVGKVITEF